jgi:hypothetical protein
VRVDGIGERAGADCHQLPESDEPRPEGDSTSGAFNSVVSLALPSRDPSENVTRPQSRSEPVRVVENDDVIDAQIKR